MSLGTTNQWLPVWPLGSGRNTFGDCTCCGSAAGTFYDVLCVGGGHGGDICSVTRDFATPPRMLFLVGEFTTFADLRWNDDPDAPAQTFTRYDTARIAKIWFRDTGNGVKHPQVSAYYAQNAGFSNAPLKLRRNRNLPDATPSGPPCEIFVFRDPGFTNAAPLNLTWSVPSRTVLGTTYSAESVASPVHKLGIGGDDWTNDDPFQAGWTSFRYPSYGTPGSTHAKGCPTNALQVGLRGGTKELIYPIEQGITLKAYGPDGALNWTADRVNTLFATKPMQFDVGSETFDQWGFAGAGHYVSDAGSAKEFCDAELRDNPGGSPEHYLLPGGAGGVVGGSASAVDLYYYSPATNAAGSWPAVSVTLLRVATVDGWAWNPSGASADLVGGMNLSNPFGVLGGWRATAGQLWNLTLGDFVSIFDVDADGRLYFGGNGVSFGGVTVDDSQLYRVGPLGQSPVQIGTFKKNGALGTVFGCQVICDPSYGGSGIAHAVVVGDFDAYAPPSSASSTTEVRGLIGVAVISIRNSQTIAAQSFWPGRFRAGEVTVNDGDWLPGLVIPS